MVCSISAATFTRAPQQARAQDGDVSETTGDQGSEGVVRDRLAELVGNWAYETESVLGAHYSDPAELATALEAATARGFGVGIEFGPALENSGLRYGSFMSWETIDGAGSSLSGGYTVQSVDESIVRVLARYPDGYTQAIDIDLVEDGSATLTMFDPESGTTHVLRATRTSRESQFAPGTYDELVVVPEGHVFERPRSTDDSVAILFSELRQHGELTDPSVADVLEAHRDELLECYADAFRGEPNDYRTWRFEWTVNGTSAEEVSATFVNGEENDGFVRCVTRAIEDWAFGASPDGNPYPVRGNINFSFVD